MKEKRILSIASVFVLICCTGLVLTSCSERISDDRLAQLEPALLVATSKEQADEAALAQAIAAGASPETIAALKKTVENDGIYLVSLFAQLNPALALAKSREEADEVALTQAIEDGAGAETIAALRQRVAMDELQLQYLLRVMSGMGGVAYTN